MSKAITERLSQVAVILAVVSFGITYLRTDDLMTALGVVGIAYLFGSTIAIPFLVRDGEMLKSQGGRVLSFVLVVGMLACYSWFLLYRNPQDLDSFGYLQIFGELAVILAAIVLIVLAVLDYRGKIKECPDCAETVLRKAHVCKYCGFRWSSPKLDTEMSQ